MSKIVEIADAVVAALNAQPFAEEFTAERAYLPRYEPADLAEMRVTVVPRELEITSASRMAMQNDVRIDVAIQKKLGDPAAEAAEIDALMGLVEQIASYLRAIGIFAGAVWLGTENAPIYAPEHLAGLRVFTSVLTLTLRFVTS